ncbi:MAG: carboxypeptidase-like regulatory domain-containing protein [Planctomycetota bacterium]
MRWILPALVVIALGAWWWSGSEATERSSHIDRDAVLPADPAPAAVAPLEGIPAEEAVETPIRIRFRVTADGHPVAGAEVRILQTDDAGETDAEGLVTLGGFEEGSDYWVRKAGYRTVVDSEWEGDRVEVQLVSSVPVRGRVVEAGSRRAVVGARVGVFTRGPSPIPLDAILRTDGNGEFLVSGAFPLEGARVQVHAPGFVPASVEVTGDALPEIVLGSGCRIEGQISGPDGRPLPRAVVAVETGYDADMWLERDAWVRRGGHFEAIQHLQRTFAVTDERGHYAVRGLRPEVFYYLVAFGPEQGEARIPLIRFLENETRLRHDLQLRSPASIRIELATELDAGDGPVRFRVRGIERRTYWRDEWVDERGRTSYEAADLVPGRYRVSVSVEGYRWWYEELTLAPGEQRMVKASLDRGSSIAGVVVDRRGHPVPNVPVEFMTGSGDLRFKIPSGRAITTSAGRFRIAGLENKTGLLRARVGLSFRGELVKNGERYSPIEVEGARPDGPPYRLVLPDEASVTCTVVPDHKHMMFLIDGRLGQASVERLGAGRYRIGHLALGRRMKLLVRCPGRAPATRILAPLREGEARDLGEFRLSEGRTVWGRVVDESGVAVGHASVQALGPDSVRGLGPDSSDWDRADANGEFRIPHQPRSVSEVVATSRGYIEARGSWEVGHGEAGITLVLARGGILTGEVVDAVGSPVLVEEGHLRCRREESGQEPRPRVDASGRFRIRLVPGFYIVELRDSDEEDARIVFRRRVEIRNGQTTRLTVQKP